MRELKNKISDVRFLVIAAIVLFLLGGFIYLSRLPSPTRLYINKALDFKFNYDADSKIEFEGKRPNATSLFTLEISNPILAEAKKENNVEFFDRQSEMFLVLTVNSGSNCPFKDSELKNITRKKLEIASLQSVLVQGDTDQDAHEESVCFEAVEKTFWLLNQYSNKSSEQIKRKSQEFFNQVLSSFEVIK